MADRRHCGRARSQALPSELNLFLQDNDLLELALDKLLKLKDRLIFLVAPQDDVQLCKRRLILVELSLHESVVSHQRL